MMTRLELLTQECQIASSEHMTTLSVTHSLHRGLPAWELVGSLLRVKITEIGGHIASITHTTDEINPLWQVSE